MNLIEKILDRLEEQLGDRKLTDPSPGTGWKKSTIGHKPISGARTIARDSDKGLEIAVSKKAGMRDQAKKAIKKERKEGMPLAKALLRQKTLKGLRHRDPTRKSNPVDPGSMRGEGQSKSLRSKEQEANLNKIINKK